jgi:phosphatidylserine/phosphatidylglycerophosphate/cardiolipin synthase-like enzyme
MPDDEIQQFISFYCLRTFDFFRTKLGDYVPKTEQIYVHTKLMIVDDRTGLFCNLCYTSFKDKIL